jgi:hypothetical protein
MRARTIHQSPAQLIICLTHIIVPFDGMQQVINDRRDVGRIVAQLLQHQREEVAIENFKNILLLVSSKSSVELS